MKDVGIILQNCDIPSVLTENGIIFERRQSKRGYELYFPCPTNNHQDDPDKKRCSISEAGSYKGMFNCWACDFRGNLVHLLEYINGWSFLQTLNYLEGKFGSSEVIGTQGLTFRLKMMKPDNVVKADLPTFELPNDYAPLLQRSGEGEKMARNWLNNERHITDDFIEFYQIGSSIHAKLGFVIIIPVWFKNQIHSIFYAQPWKGGAKRYPKNSPQGEIIFNYDRCLSAKRYILVESILDAIKIESLSGELSMSCFTNMISENQLNLLQHFDEHGIMPDLDGERGWDLVTRVIPKTGKSTWLYFVPIGKDPGDCSPQEMSYVLSSRQRYCDYETNYYINAIAPQVAKIKGIGKMQN